MVKYCTNDLTVCVDAQVLLRIAKHAKQNYPASASGSLLGIDVDSRDEKELRVTNCFGYRTAKGTDTSALIGGALASEQNIAGTSADDFTEYQYQMLSALAETRADANACGWYESTHHGNFMNEALIENQYAFQKEVPNAVVIVYDPFQLKIGKSGFAAYRLSNEAMKRRKRAEDNDEEEAFDKFPSDKLLERVPITVHCSPLVETMLLQYQNNNFDCLDTDSIAPALERNVQLLLESLDEFSLQQREMQMYERNTRKNQKDQRNQRVPKSVDTLNLSKQIQEHCKNIDSYASDSFGKLFMVSESAEVRDVMTALGSE